MNSIHSIGEILVASGRLTNEKLQRILERQRQDQTPFGEAAITLNLLIKDDIDFALSKQFDYAYLSTDDSSLRPELVAAFKPFSRVGENMRALRSQLMLRWFNADLSHKVLTIVSAASGEGRSFTAANLAIVFAQQGQRTLLIDADLRSQSENNLQALFNLNRSAGLTGILSGRADYAIARPVPGIHNLTVIPAGAQPPNPQELLGRQTFGSLLSAMVAHHDIILIDTPPGAEYADAEIVASRAGAAIMVLRQNVSLLPDTVAFSRRLQDAGVALIGSVFNQV
jgi:receptor protein-tyrosine kinase